MEKPPDEEKITDIDFARSLVSHIVNPCGPSPGVNIREFYLSEARRALPTMTDPWAIRLLVATIAQYS